MRRRIIAGVLMALVILSGTGRARSAGQAPALPQPPPTLSSLEREVWDTETAFAKTMAARDHAAFVSFLSPETIFQGGAGPLRGRESVAAAWKRFYEGPRAPFSWAPDRAVVLDSGTLASTSGPVFDPSGKRTGTFNSVWRKDADGKWRVIFDSGCPECKCGETGDKE
jgi:ketosteroid isomerase-like protein